MIGVAPEIWSHKKASTMLQTLHRVRIPADAFDLVSWLNHNLGVTVVFPSNIIRVGARGKLVLEEDTDDGCYVWPEAVWDHYTDTDGERVFLFKNVADAVEFKLRFG